MTYYSILRSIACGCCSGTIQSQIVNNLQPTATHRCNAVLLSIERKNGFFHGSDSELIFAFRWWLLERQCFISFPNFDFSLFTINSLIDLCHREICFVRYWSHVIDSSIIDHHSKNKFFNPIEAETKNHSKNGFKTSRCGQRLWGNARRKCSAAGKVTSLFTSEYVAAHSSQ